jgi:exportin-T
LLINFRQLFLSTRQDLLVINAELPDSEPPSEAVLTKAASSSGLFESQLYLFETVGTLISILNQVPAEQVALLNAVLDPLLSQLEQSVRPSATSPADYNAVFTAHHLIMAIGNVAKGFPDLSARQPTAQGEWVQGFRKATEAVLASAKIMAGFVVIRDAVRSHSFSPNVRSSAADRHSMRDRPASLSIESSRRLDSRFST